MISVYSFDRQTRRMSGVNGGMTNVYTYSADGRLQSVSIPGSGDVSYQYDDRGLNAEIQLPGGIRRIMEYDGFGQLVTNRVVDAAGNNVLAQGFQRSLTGSIQTKTTDAGIWAYSYDLTGQLTNAVLDPVDPVQNFFYVYDAMRNRLFNRESAQGTQKESIYQPNNLNQYDWTVSTNLTTSTASTNVLSYDLNGNLTNDGVRAYGWDTRNQLVKVEPLIATNGSLIVEFSYDCMGRRISKDVSVYQESGFTNQASHIFFTEIPLAQLPRTKNQVIIPQRLTKPQALRFRAFSGFIDAAGCRKGFPVDPQ